MRLINNKLKKPLYFEGKDIKYEENIFRNSIDWGYFKISDIKNIPQLIDREQPYKFSTRDLNIYKFKGVLCTNKKIICIIVYENEKLKAIVNRDYFTNNSSHQTFINKFIKSYDIKLKDVVFYESDDLKNQFNYIYTASLDDMDEKVQKVLSSKFITEAKLQYNE